MKELYNGLNLITLEPTQKKLIEHYLGPGAFEAGHWVHKVKLSKYCDTAAETVSFK